MVFGCVYSGERGIGVEYGGGGGGGVCVDRLSGARGEARAKQQ